MSVQQSAVSRGPAQSMVEFALVVPVFLLLLFGLIDFARLEFSYISLANAAREMGRVAAIPANSSDSVVDSFNNFASLILSPPSATDTVTITVADRTCAATLAAGPGPCAAGHTPSVFACPLPLTHATCSVPTRTGLAGGSVDVVATNQYMFSPLFQNRLTGMIDASFMMQWATLSTTARTYIE
jgi:Flp pilus assembly protein TadG